MKKISVVCIPFLFLAFAVSPCSANSNLFDWAYYADGTTYQQTAPGDSMPTIGTLDDEGLGTLKWKTNIVGSHTFIAFFDHEIDESTNTFFNEYGSVNGTPATGQSWEIDEPGFLFGDIYDNVLEGSLDNTNEVPSGSEDDVSWALGWDFFVGADQTVIIKLTLSKNPPSTGFYLSQTDPDSNETIYFFSTISYNSVADIVEYLPELIIDLEITEQGLEDGLLDKATELQEKIDAGNIGAACQQINAMINQTNGQRKNFDPPEEADELIEYLQDIQILIGC